MVHYLVVFVQSFSANYLSFLLLAVKAYAVETESYTRSKVCFADNWFKMRRWEKGLAQVQADRAKALEAKAKGRASSVEWILGRHPTFQTAERRLGALAR